MVPWLGPPANPSSLHAPGRAARDAIDLARQAFCGALGAEFAEAGFCASGSEAAASAALGLAAAAPGRRRVLASAAEHECVLKQRAWLGRLGLELEILPVDRYGRLELDALEQALGPDVAAAFVMDGQNETGARNDVAAAAALCQEAGVPLAVDAVQTFPSARDAWGSGAAALFASAHKFGGPGGVGLLFLRAGVAAAPLLEGGGQERGRRAGTESVAAIVGAAAALQGPSPQAAEAARILADHLVEEAGFEPTLDGDYRGARLATVVHGRFPGVRAETLLVRLDRAGVQASAGSACASGGHEPSHVLDAMGWSSGQAAEAVRFSFGWASTAAQAEEAAGRIVETVRAVRASRASNG